jgi:hypothetical protein
MAAHARDRAARRCRDRGRARYGDGNTRPEDDFAAFQTFIQQNKNSIAALAMVINEPSNSTLPSGKDVSTRSSTTTRSSMTGSDHVAVACHCGIRFLAQV